MEEEEEEGDEGSGDGLGDPIQLTAEGEDSHHHKPSLAWPCHPTSNAWQVASNWKPQHTVKCVFIT